MDEQSMSCYERDMAARAKRARKRHVQQLLFRHGGKRKGSGRKPKGDRAGAPHDTRPQVDGSQVLHVVMRVARAVGSLRRRDMYKAMRAATIVAAQRGGFRIVHLSLQRTHVHMLVEADDKQALGRGMQGFQISAARNINTALGTAQGRRKGPVFVDRYHLVVITSPTQTRRALRYVLNNWRRHREDQDGLPSTWQVDPFSTGVLFSGWKEVEDGLVWDIPPTYEAMVVSPPQSWLLQTGWRRMGEISVRDVPKKL